MKILLFIESLHSGGKERRFVELVDYLKKNTSYELKVVLIKEGIHYAKFLELGIQYTIIKRKNFRKDPRLFFKFFTIARKFKPDLIHAWGGMAAFYSIPTKVLLRIPLINNQIVDAPSKISFASFTNLTNKINFIFSNFIIANSKAGLKAYKAPHKKSSVIYNGFNSSRIENIEKPEKVRSRFEIDTKHVVGMVASFSSLKDYKTYINTAIEILTQRNDVTFLCIGKGDSTIYEEMVKRYFDRVLFLGQQTDIESIMNICDIGILSTFTEGLPNAVLEFMALGKPVVATNGGGTDELIIDNETGYLFPMQSKDVLFDRINKLLNDRERRELMGEKSKNRVLNHFNIELMGRQFVYLYNRLYEKRYK